MKTFSRAAFWTITGLLAVIFVMIGLSKLAGPSSVRWADRFTHWGYPAGSHYVVGVVEALRQIILGTDREIGEEIKWNAPTFFFTGEMKPSNPREFKRYVVVFNLYKKDCIRLVFPSGPG